MAYYDRIQMLAKLMQMREDVGGNVSNVPTTRSSMPPSVDLGGMVNLGNLLPQQQQPQMPTKSGGKLSGDPEFSAFIKAMKQQESGNYNARNPQSGALGAYQILPSNIPAWAKETIGRKVSPQEFKGNKALQDEIAQGKLKKYVKKFGYEGAASAWYSGSPTKYKTSHQGEKGGYPAVSSYVKQVMSKMRKAKGGD